MIETFSARRAMQATRFRCFCECFAWLRIIRHTAAEVHCYTGISICSLKLASALFPKESSPHRDEHYSDTIVEQFMYYIKLQVSSYMPVSVSICHVVHRKQHSHLPVQRYLCIGAVRSKVKEQNRHAVIFTDRIFGIRTTYHFSFL